MNGVNKVILLGNVGAAPDVRTTQAGDTVATLKVATSDVWKDKATGERKERTEWHRVVVFGGAANFVSQYVGKGDKVYVEGSLRTRKWAGQDGVERYTTEVVVSGFGTRINKLSGKRNDGAAQDGLAAPSATSEPAAEEAEPNYAAELQDDVPF